MVPAQAPADVAMDEVQRVVACVACAMLVVARFLAAMGHSHLPSVEDRTGMANLVASLGDVRSSMPPASIGHTPLALGAVMYCCLPTECPECRRDTCGHASLKYSPVHGQ